MCTVEFLLAIQIFKVVIHCLTPKGERISYYIGYRRVSDGTKKTGAEAYIAVYFSRSLNKCVIFFEDW